MRAIPTPEVQAGQPTLLQEFESLIASVSAAVAIRAVRPSVEGVTAQLASATGDIRSAAEGVSRDAAAAAIASERSSEKFAHAAEAVDASLKASVDELAGRSEGAARGVSDAAGQLLRKADEISSRAEASIADMLERTRIAAAMTALSEAAATLEGATVAASGEARRLGHMLDTRLPVIEPELQAFRRVAESAVELDAGYRDATAKCAAATEAVIAARGELSQLLGASRQTDARLGALQQSLGPSLLKTMQQLAKASEEGLRSVVHDGVDTLAREVPARSIEALEARAAELSATLSAMLQGGLSDSSTALRDMAVRFDAAQVRLEGVLEAVATMTSDWDAHQRTSEKALDSAAKALRAASREQDDRGLASERRILAAVTSSLEHSRQVDAHFAESRRRDVVSWALSLCAAVASAGLLALKLTGRW